MRLGWWTVALVLAAVIAIPAYLIFSSSQDEEDPSPGVSVSEIAHQRGKHLGDTVTLRAEIQEIYSPKLLLIGPDEDPSERIVVATEKPIQAKESRASPREGQLVEVTGRVDAVDLRELNEGGDPVAESAERDLADRALIQAERLVLTPAGPPESDRAEVKPREVLAHPERHLGDLTTVSGTADRVYSPHAFSLNGLLVVSGLNGADEVFAGDSLAVTGPTRRFDARELEGETGVDLPAELDRFEGEPVIVARGLSRAGKPPHPQGGVDPRSLE